MHHRLCFLSLYSPLDSKPAVAKNFNSTILFFFSFFLFCRVLLPPPVQATNNYTLAPATEQSFSSVCLTLITTTQMGRAGEMCKWPAGEKQPINNNAGMELKNKRDGRLADAAGVNTSPSSSRFSVRPR